MMQLIEHIPRNDVIMRGNLTKGQVRTRSVSIMERIKLSMGVMAFRRTLMLRSKTFLRNHLKTIRKIAMFGECRVICGGIGDVL